ncbi:hypothetical protein GW17_00013999 [Ensete ventricosum]|nr:hypothetical protein GW17_00013999 [Ensete ventricosum]
MWLLHSFLRAASLVCRSLLGVRGYCLSVDSYVYPNTPLIASCQGSGGTVHRSATTSALTRQLLGVRGAGLARRLCCTARYQGGQLVGCRAVRGYPEVGSGKGRRLDVAELNPFRCYFMGRTCKSYVGVWIAAKRIATKLFDLLGGVARKLFGSGVMDMWRLAVA